MVHLLSDSGSRTAFSHSWFADELERVLPDGVQLIEVPVGEELSKPYGASSPTGRHALLADWFGRHEPYAEPLAVAPMSLTYTSGRSTSGCPE